MCDITHLFLDLGRLHIKRASVIAVAMKCNRKMVLFFLWWESWRKIVIDYGVFERIYWIWLKEKTLKMGHMLTVMIIIYKYIKVIIK